MTAGTWRLRPSQPVDHLAGPAISVVVPVFRTEEHLERCLASLGRQTFRDFEVIVVDDASPGGGAAEIVRDLGDTRMTLIRHTANLGLMQARFTGVRAARGRYISFVDSDDTIDERFLEVLHAAASQHGADLVQCTYLVDEMDGTSRWMNRGGDQYDLQGDQILRAMLAGRMSNSLWSKLVRTDLLMAVYEELSAFSKRVDYGEDLLTTFHLVCRADHYVHIPDPLYRYRQHANSMTGAGNAAALIAKVESLSWIFDRIRPVLAQRGAPPEHVDAFYAREFLEPIVTHLKDAREQGAVGPVGSPMSTAELGLLGAVLADAYGMLDSRTAATDHSASGP